MLSLVHGAEKISKAEIVKRSSFSQTHVYLLLDGLVERGYLQFLPGEIKGKGKPSPRVALDLERLATVGLSFTADAVRIAVLDLAGERLIERPLMVQPNEPEVVRAAVAAELVNVANELPRRELIGLGIAMQGFRMGQADQFRTPPDLAAWRDYALHDFFRDLSPTAIIAENNATSAAIAEQLVGAGKDDRCLAYLSFNVGFGAGFVWNRKAVFGGHGNAGEISHMYPPEEMHLRPALGELLKHLNKNGVQVNDLNELATRFDPHWPCLQDWIGQVTPSLKTAIRAIKALIDPNAIYFGGDAPEGLRKMLIEAADISDLRYETPDPELKMSALVGDSAHIGAALLPMHQLLLDGQMES